MNLFGEEKYDPRDPAYLRAAESAAHLAISDWLESVHAEHMYLFEVDGVECALERFTGHWGMEARWRWGRTAAGDPDEDESGENILLDVALGRTFLLSSDVHAVELRCSRMPRSNLRQPRSLIVRARAQRTTWRSSCCTGSTKAHPSSFATARRSHACSASLNSHHDETLASSMLSLDH